MTTLYAGGLVFDGEGAVLSDHGVLVEGERIARLAPISEFEGYSGARVDTSGGTLLPPDRLSCPPLLWRRGNPFAVMNLLRDSEIVMRALDRAQASLKGGITGLRDCGGKDYLEFAVRDACNQGRQLGPTIRASGKVICMTGGHGNRTGRVADGVDEVIKAVREQIHAGSDLIKIMATGGVMTPGVNPEDAHSRRRRWRRVSTKVTASIRPAPAMPKAPKGF